ncbi:glycosyl hydrolase [Arthrobacter jiangjiafuii]|uniref:Glycosyl hydrolase n=1 Tax=Arthrobacter jiangjiafuii TaxID=2817475 RepID=A0A975M613_9MICC|nr:glycoside hydrolase family 76 protein [Arthrobacter jiangjiafuii]MBP3044761.1 glycosyl hydrolase [Arthrobacter jiangjiafuii]QWC10409.1 glycosyl hydrolase [Arthrobacter jiangjiafuii]
MPDEEPLHDIPARASHAAASVTAAFARPVFGLPGTRLAAVQSPAPRRILPGPWHYWWQAHYVDALVDAALRGAPDAAAQAQLAVRSIRLRNGLRATNWFFDDMAWLALAVGRLDSLQPDGRPGRTLPDTYQEGDGGAPAAKARPHPQMMAALTEALRSAHTPEFGGGLFWNRKRTFKNTPATAPAALHFARTGDRERAQSLVDWLNAVLLDPQRGLYLDGIKAAGPSGGTVLEGAVFTYNQGPVLGALLELGGPANLSRAAELIAAVRTRLTHPGSAVLLTHGTGDAGLFTGILCRYLALAAVSATLPAEARKQAAELVSSTADAVWAGRAARNGHSVFSPHPLEPAGQHYPAGAAVGLSTQLSAWIILEAAVRVERGQS